MAVSEIRRWFLGLLFCLIWSHGVTAAPYAYVCNADDNDVTYIDLSTDTPEAPTILVGGEVPIGIATTPDGSRAYVCNYGSNDVTYIDLLTNTPGPSRIPVGISPRAIAITPDGSRAYVCNSGSNDITYIDLSTNIPGPQTISVGTAPFAIAITPDGSRAYVCTPDDDTVIYIDLSTNTPGDNPIPVGTHPDAIAITPDGSKAYVCNYGSNSVTYIDLSTNTPGVFPIPVESHPAAIAITPDGLAAYVCNNGRVTHIDLSTNLSGLPISVGDHPVAIAIATYLAPAALFSYTVGGRTATFDASGSSSPVGSIASYAWDFGDGQIETTSSSTISHTYSTSGTMTVILRVTSTVGFSAETSQQISVQVSGGGIAHFKGKVHRRHKPYMGTWWSKSTLPHTVKYRIFARDRKIATVKVRHEKQKTIRLHPKHHRVGSKKYRHYLENKYNIRAVDALGQVGQPTFIHVKKS